MSKNRPIKMKKAAKNSDPARIAVLHGSNDDVFTAYVREISDYPSLSAKEEKEIAKRAKEGDSDAKKQLIQSHLKLVLTIARKAIHHSKLPMIDLIQEGNLGLMIAAEKFNPKLGYRFATYAGWWIKQSMFKAISEQTHCMKIPVYIQETLSKFSKIKSEMERLNNCAVQNKDVAQKMNIEPDKIEGFLSAYTKTISIESGLENANGKELHLADILADENASATETVEYEELQNEIQMIVSTLKEREQDVVRMRFGLQNAAKRTLEEIGNMYGVTKECIRQTELRALKKLRSAGYETLSGYIG